MAEPDPFISPQGSGNPPPSTVPPPDSSDAAASRYVQQQNKSVSPQEEEFARGALNIFPGGAEGIGGAIEGAEVKAANIGHRLAGQPIPFTSAQAETAFKQQAEQTDKNYSSKHPWKAAGLQILGGVATPGVGPADAALAARGVAPVARAGVIGGAMGAGMGWNDSKGQPLAQRAESAGMGAAEGVAGGVGAHAAGVVVGGIANAAQKRVRAAIENMKLRQDWKPGDAPTPKMVAAAHRQAAREVGDMARQLDPHGTKLSANPQEKRGAPITAAEALGRRAENRLKIAGKLPGATQDVLPAAIGERAASTSERIVGDFGHVTGIDPEAVDGNFKTALEKLRTQAAPYYDKFYAVGPVDSDELRAIADTPTGKKAMVRAVKIMQDERLNPHDLGVEMKSYLKPHKLTTSSGEDTYHVPVTEEVEVKTPTARTWDYFKRGLDDELDSYRQHGRLENLDNQGRATVKLVSALRDELTRPDTAWGPAYSEALAHGGEAPRLEEAYRGARRAMAAGTTEAQFERQIERYTPAQIDGLKAGIIADVRNAARGPAKDVYRQLSVYQSPSYRAKLAKVFGPDQAEQIIQRVKDERFLLDHGRRLTQGSDTFENFAADRDAQNAADTYLKMGKAALTQRWMQFARHAADLAMTPYRKAQMPLDEATRDIVGAIYMASPSEAQKMLEKYGASPQQASMLTKLWARMGVFQAAHASVVSGVAGNQAVHGLLNPPSLPPSKDDFARPEGKPDPNDPFSDGGAAQKPEAAPARTPASNDDSEPDAKMYFVSQNWPDVAAEAIKNELMQESGGKANPGQNAYNAGSHGVAQWRGERLEDFRKFIGKPVDEATLADQYRFIHHELTDGKYKDVGDALKRAKTVDEAMNILLTRYEKPEDTAVAKRWRGPGAPPLTGDGTPALTGGPAEIDWSQFAPDQMQ